MAGRRRVWPGLAQKSASFAPDPGISLIVLNQNSFKNGSSVVLFYDCVTLGIRKLPVRIQLRWNWGEISMDGGAKKMTPMKFQSILQDAVPKGRDGKHKEIVSQLLR